MYRNKKILVVVPARGGSKGIPKKNLKKINGKTLIKITADCIKNTKYIDDAVISSDDKAIILDAQKNGLSFYFKRPSSLSGDRVPDVPVLINALNETEKKVNKLFDYIIMLQPTAPLRKPNDIEKIIKKIIDENLDTVWTIHEVESKYHPDKQLKINNKGFLDFFTFNGKTIISRQDLTKSYMKNGIGYAISRTYLLKKEKLMGIKSGFILLKGPIINIDDMEDLSLARKMIRQKKT